MPAPCVDSFMDECVAVAVAVAEAVAVAVTEAVAEADQSIHDQSIHDPSIRAGAPRGPKGSQKVKQIQKNKKMVETDSHSTILSNSRTKNDARRVRNVVGALQTPKKPVKN